MACMIKVDDWEPELPPVDNINGIKLANTNTLANSSSKYPMAVAVNNSPINKTTNHVILFLNNLKIEISK